MIRDGVTILASASSFTTMQFFSLVVFLQTFLNCLRAFLVDRAISLSKE
jgi:hypothetical protein